MELEQRVQVLEQEVQILKSQIQAALLEIQELLLSQEHPSLHSVDPDIPTRAFAEAETLPAPPVRRVSLNPNAEVAATVPPTPPPAPPPQASAEASPDWTKMAKLEKWASEKVQQVGAKKTREMIKLYAEQGRFNRHVRDQLLRFVAIYEEDEAPSPKHISAKENPAIKHVPPMPPTTNHETDSAQKLVLRLIAGVQNVGIQPMRRKNG
jgi:hypothetical protein